MKQRGTEIISDESALLAHHHLPCTNERSIQSSVSADDDIVTDLVPGNGIKPAPEGRAVHDIDEQSPPVFQQAQCLGEDIPVSIRGRDVSEGIAEDQYMVEALRGEASRSGISLEKFDPHPQPARVLPPSVNEKLRVVDDGAFFKPAVMQFHAVSSMASAKIENLLFGMSRYG